MGRGGGNSGSEIFTHSVVSREIKRVELGIDSERMIFSLYHSASITKEKLPKKTVNLSGTYEPRQAVEVLTFDIIQIGVILVFYPQFIAFPECAPVSYCEATSNNSAFPTSGHSPPQTVSLISYHV